VDISIEKLVELVVSRVMAEIARQGVTVTPPGSHPPAPGAPERQSAGHGSAARHDAAAAAPAAPGTRLVLDFQGYRTPVLNESRVRGAGPHIREIVVPARTIVTAGARDLLEQRRLKLTFTSTQP